ncbi:hypothetical protein [Paenibacillus sp. NPDC055715]
MRPDVKRTREAVVPTRSSVSSSVRQTSLFVIGVKSAIMHSSLHNPIYEEWYRGDIEVLVS